jgi:hypothetical protein
MAKQTIIMNTELKLGVSINPMGDIHASGYNFTVDFFCSPRKVKSFTKEDLLPIDDDNFIALLDTAEVGTGELRCLITAYIPDEDFTNDGTRTEILEIVTDYNIIKGL